MNNKYKKFCFIFSCVVFTGLTSVSCSFSIKPVYNSKNETKSQAKTGNVTDIKNRDDLKVKAIEAVKQLHKLMEERKFEEAYQMIDDNSALKQPKTEVLKSLQEVVEMLGKVEKIDLNKDNVVEDKSVNNGQLQVRQEFVVKFEKDTPSPKRYELFIWNVSPDNSLKLWNYINSKGDD